MRCNQAELAVIATNPAEIGRGYVWNGDTVLP